MHDGRWSRIESLIIITFVGASPPNCKVVKMLMVNKETNQSIESQRKHNNIISFAIYGICLLKV